MPKYSVITPMYNSFDLMEKYFSSLESQTCKDFEVIIVDDCSTDNSYEKAVGYARNSNLNISVYKTEENLGPGNARNIGMDKASGKWITFIDNDDWVEINLFEKIEAALLKNNVHCVVYDYYIQRENDSSVSQSMYCGNEGIIPLSESIKYVRNHAIGKVYDLECCRNKNVRFPNLRRCEDVAFAARAVEACESVYYLHEPLYYYYQRSASLSNNKSMDQSGMIEAFSILEKELGGRYPLEIKEKSVTDLLYGSVLMMCKNGKSGKEIRAFIDGYTKKYPGWEKCSIINYLGKSKRIFLKFVKLKMVFSLKLLSLIHTKLIG